MGADRRDQPDERHKRRRQLQILRSVGRRRCPGLGLCVSGAAHHEVVRCSTGTFTDADLATIPDQRGTVSGCAAPDLDRIKNKTHLNDENFYLRLRPQIFFYV
jgi:hypothetical protein